MNNGNGDFDRRCRPTDIMDGWSGAGVSQQSVDAFFTKNGLDIHEDPEHDETGFTDLENPCAYKNLKSTNKFLTCTLIGNLASTNQ